MAKSVVIKRGGIGFDRATDIYIDGAKIEGVISYELKEDKFAQLTLTIFVEDAEVRIQSEKSTS